MMRRYWKQISLTIPFLIVFQLFSPMVSIFALDEHYKSPYEKECVLALNKLNIVAGYEDHTFRPEKELSRAEFVTILVRMMGLENKDAGAECPFWDVSSDFWAYRYICISSSKKYVSGYEDGTFRPGGTITYAEAVAVLVRILGYAGQVSGEWPYNYINKGEDINLSPNLKLPANNRLTRGDAFVLIADALMAKIS